MRNAQDEGRAGHHGRPAHRVLQIHRVGVRSAALRCAALRCAALSWAEAEVCAEERSERAGRADRIGWDVYIVLTAVGRYEPPMMHLSYASSPSPAALCHGAAGGACVFVARLHRPSRAIGFCSVGASSNASGHYACVPTTGNPAARTAGTRPTRRSTSARCFTCRCGRSTLSLLLPQVGNPALRIVSAYCAPLRT